MTTPSTPCDRAIALVRAIAAGEFGPALVSLTGSRQTLVRDLASLRRDLGVMVTWIPSERRYVIEDWGVLRKATVLNLKGGR